MSSKTTMKDSGELQIAINLNIIYPSTEFWKNIRWALFFFPSFFFAPPKKSQILHLL